MKFNTKVLKVSAQVLISYGVNEESSPNEQQTERGSRANLTQSVRREFDHPMTGLSVEVCSEIKVVPREKN